MFKKIEAAYRAKVYTRADGNGAIFYFDHTDFDGLKKEEYSFRSGDGHRLSGAFYYYDGCDDERIIVFDHGMGSGHRGYMKEIELIARHGYRVFAYDHTGCMKSEGETTGGFVQSLKDLNDALTALKADTLYKGKRYSVVGHSWGGFAALNICAFHHDVDHIVAISGYISAERVIRGSFKGILSGFGKRIVKQETLSEPEFMRCDALTALKTANAHVLVIHSEDDPILSFKDNFEVLRREFEGQANFTFLKTSGKAHNPNYTTDAVRYKDIFFADFTREMKAGSLSDEKMQTAFKNKYDWHRMTAQDDEVWKVIFETLDK